MRKKKQSMGKHLSFALAGILLFSQLGGAAAQAQELKGSPVELFVSLEGNDSGQGTQNDPFRTLEGARDKIRAMKKNTGLPQEGVVVNIAGGEYPYLEDSFTMTEEDSGTQSSPVIYRGMEGEEVKLVGNMVVDGSKFMPVTETAIRDRLGEEARDKVLVYDLKKENGIEKFAPIPKNGYGWPAQANAMAVLVDGEAQTLSRFPNSGFLKISSIQQKGFVPRDHLANPDGTCPQCTKDYGSGKRIVCRYGEDKYLDQPGGSFTVNNSELKSKYPLWNQEKDIWTSGYFCWDWADDNCAIQSIAETFQGISMTMRHPSRYGVTGSGRTFYAYNLLCEVDSPGEWYLDRESGKLYLYPAKDMKDSRVELAMQTQPLVKMNNVSNVKWENVSFSKSNGHGIQMTDCNEVEIAGCRFSDLGQRAVFMGDPNAMDVNTGAHGGSGNTIRSCDITRVGQGGIYMGGGNRYTLTPGGNQVVNCDISDFSTIKRTYSPAVEMVGCGNSVERNRIYNAPHTAIMYSGNEMLIQGNEIFDVCYETADVGAIYSVRRWSYQGVTVKNNFIHDLVSTGGIGSAAVYVDDLGSGTTMTENLLVNIPGYTTLFGGGRDNVITNNIQINKGNGAGLQYDNRGQGWAWYHSAGPDGECYGELVGLRANPAYDKAKWDAKYPSLAAIDLTTKTNRTDKGEGFKDYYTEAAKPANADIEKNIMVGVGNPYGNVNDTVKKLGTYADNQSHPVGTDIGFANADAYDYTVKPDSIITDLLGDKHFDVTEMGLYEDEYRTLDIVPIEKPALLSPDQKEEGVIVTNGVRFNWGNVERAGTYILEIASDEAFTDIVQTASVSSAPVLAMGLEKSSVYYWRVTAREKRVNGAVSVSEVRSFTTSDKDDTSFFEGFRDFSQWETVVENGTAKGKPTHSTDRSKSGRYSYVLDEGMDAIQKVFGTRHNDIVTVWVYDNMQMSPGSAAITNVTRQENGSNPWVGAGISVPTSGKGGDTYVCRDGGSWVYSSMKRTEGWHQLKFDYTDGQTCKVYVDDTMIHIVENAPYYDRILMGDFWNHNGYAGDISGMNFDDLSVGDPVIKENILSISLPESSIQLRMDETYQIAPVVETDPDSNVALEYRAQEHEIARVDENGLITPNRAGSTIVTVQSVKNPAINAVLQVEVSGEVNKDALRRQYDAALKLVKADYTPESWEVLVQALVGARTELQSTSSTAETVSNAYAVLEAAQNSLVDLRPNVAGENSGFEKGSLEGFGQYPAKEDEGIKKEITTEDAYEGNFSAKISTTPSIPHDPGSGTGYKHKGLMYTIPGAALETGSQYDISFWVKSADQKAPKMGARAIFRNNLGDYYSDWAVTGNEWTRINYQTPQIPQGIDRLEIVMGNENTQESAGVYYIDQVSIRKKTPSVPAESISLNMESASVSSGDSISINVSITPENATNDTIMWFSSDTNVATVEKGAVTAVNPGTAVITATALDGEFTASCTVSVEIPVTGVELSAAEINAMPGQQFQLTAAVKPDNASNKEVDWESSDEAVASVENGVVTCVSTGDAIITVTTREGGFRNNCLVKVGETAPGHIPVDSVSLSETAKSVKEGEEFILTATVSPGDASNQTVTWSSSDSSVATVSGGSVAACKAGRTFITVTTQDGGLTAVCEVTVDKAQEETPPPTDQPDHGGDGGNEDQDIPQAPNEQEDNKQADSTRRKSPATYDISYDAALSHGTVKSAVPEERNGILNTVIFLCGAAVILTAGRQVCKSKSQKK